MTQIHSAKTGNGLKGCLLKTTIKVSRKLPQRICFFPTVTDIPRVLPKPAQRQQLLRQLRNSIDFREHQWPVQDLRRPLMTPMPSVRSLDKLKFIIRQNSDSQASHHTSSVTMLSGNLTSMFMLKITHFPSLYGEKKRYIRS